MSHYIDIVFDGPPSHESGRFVEVENADGRSIRVGELIEDGTLWRLRIPAPLEGTNPEAVTELLGAAKEMAAYIEAYPDPHLIDTDDNPGQRLRDAIALAESS